MALLTLHRACAYADIASAMARVIAIVMARVIAIVMAIQDCHKLAGKPLRLER